MLITTTVSFLAFGKLRASQLRRGLVRSSDRQSRPSTTRVAKAALAVLALATGNGIAWNLLFLQAQPTVFVDLDYYRAALVTVVAQQPLYPSLPYPPVAVLVIAWLGVLPVLLGNQVWTALTLLGCIVLAMVVAKRSLQAEADQGTQLLDYALPGALLAFLLLGSTPMLSQIANGQVTLLIITLAFLDVAQVLPRKAQGMLVGIAAAIKLTPLIFIPYYLVTGQRRQAAVATASFSLVTALGFALFPSDSLFFWAHLGKNDQFGDPARTDNLSIHAALARWLPAVDQMPLAWIILGLVVAGFALLRARRHFRDGDVMASALTIGASSVVLAPITWPHYDVWVVLAGLWLMLAPDRRSKLLGLGVYLVFSLPFAALVLPAAEVSLLARAVLELGVLVPVLIGLFGLPRRPRATPHTSPSAPVGQPDAAATAA